MKVGKCRNKNKYHEFPHPKLCSFLTGGEGCPCPNWNFAHLNKPQKIKDVIITIPEF